MHTDLIELLLHWQRRRGREVVCRQLHVRAAVLVRPPRHAPARGAYAEIESYRAPWPWLMSERNETSSCIASRRPVPAAAGTAATLGRRRPAWMDAW